MTAADVETFRGRMRALRDLQQKIESCAVQLDVLATQAQILDLGGMCQRLRSGVAPVTEIAAQIAQRNDESAHWLERALSNR